MHTSRLAGMAAVLAGASVLYLTLGAQGNWGFVLPYRGTKLMALIVVAVSVSTATVLFQTITHNRILTPSIMGFDALYVFVLTALVFGMGAQSYARLPGIWQFLLVLVLLVLAALVLFGTLLGAARQDLLRMVLTGIIFGVLFRSLSSFLTRMIDPNEYSFVQVSSFARFNQIDTGLLGIAALLSGAVLCAAWNMRHRLDVLALGREAALNLGENPRTGLLQVLLLVGVLVAVSTALVGPVAFLGLLVVSLAHLLTPAARHAILLPSAALIGSVTLVGGQMILERALGLTTPLSVVIDLVGGLVFLGLLLRGGIR